jgi:hypothetical protein
MRGPSCWREARRAAPERSLFVTSTAKSDPSSTRVSLEGSRCFAGRTLDRVRLPDSSRKDRRGEHGGAGDLLDGRAAKPLAPPRTSSCSPPSPALRSTATTFEAHEVDQQLSWEPACPRTLRLPARAPLPSNHRR